MADFGVSPEYAGTSKDGLDGPDQVLPSDVDTTCEPSGRVRIKFDDNDRAHEVMSVPGVLMKTVKSYGDQVALVSTPGVDGNSKTWTWKEYEAEVRIVAKAFLKLGLERYHSVGIIGFNCPQWFFADIAAIYAGGFATGIYTTNSPEACEFCAENSRANILVVEDNKQLDKILSIRNKLTHLKAIVKIDGKSKEKNVYSWEEILQIGKAESDTQLNAVLKTIGANECCTLVYTSGTTGNPKAVMLSHDNLVHDARAICQKIGLHKGQEVVVSYLPLSHIAAQIVDIMVPMAVAATVYFADKNALKGSLVETLLVARPTAFLGVPRVWEKIYEKMMAVARSNGAIKTWIATWAKAQGLQYHMNKMNGIDYKSWGYVLAKAIVFNKVKANLGFDRCKLCITGAAPLSVDIQKYFMSLDIPLMEVYGMSESTGGHSINTNDNYRLGSVGTSLPGFTTKLDNPDDTGEGEVCMSGRHIFMGYLNEHEKTKESKDDAGWLHSGDLGRLDDRGYLHITGRIKELIITAGGENVPPVPIEQTLLGELPTLSNAMLIGDKRKFLTILVTLKTDMDPDTGAPLDTLTEPTRSWATSIGSGATTVKQILDNRDPAVHAEIQEALNRTNARATSNAQKVQKFRILPHDFSLPTGELGPTLKVRRNIIVNKYADLIDEMYE
ncbi:long-chain-fatty-acid--CoA ligase ACSBG2-like isoform X2 [Venturia canescens]|nr:long-chain-fatty-acid--CoA ligase ACSBG2-like isoform X2 [Venturia canescens]XP_043283440.1 long-chain-fatty-acid--CoA ligase ACSBG2-like isoform X2 [Venturia canescens]XP_043283441.1 long-chain-fatty-acid--CoA ligase ACSBG2-like isoform X2 [Venturia canescens]XP_043283445.1 long-chain-fatty-acid--CoA ligase ACSBG2-like isoform X2 [Venturia canescens]